MARKIHPKPHLAEVVSLAGYGSKQIADLLRQLSVIAERGELRGVQIAVEDIRGTEKFCARGSYERNPRHGVQAALRLAMRMGYRADQREFEEAE